MPNASSTPYGQHLTAAGAVSAPPVIAPPCISTTAVRTVCVLLEKSAKIMEAVEAVQVGENDYSIVYREAGSRVSTAATGLVNLDREDIIELYRQKMIQLNAELASFGIQVTLDIRPQGAPPIEDAPQSHPDSDQR